MKKRVLFLWFLLGFLLACITPVSATPIRVAYLVEQGGQLPQDELKKYPEILVTSTFADFQQAASNQIALWIDKNAVKLVDSQWLDELPQSSLLDTTTLYYLSGIVFNYAVLWDLSNLIIQMQSPASV